MANVVFGTHAALVDTLNVPDPHLYFQAPGGQVLRLVGIGEDLSKYEGVRELPDLQRAEEAVKQR